MISDDFGTKELYDISLKATSNIEIGGRTFLTGETLLHFDNLQFSALADIKSRTSATGGYGNKVQISWDTTTGVEFICERGVISQEGMAVWLNSKLADALTNTLEVDYKETKEASSIGNIVLKYTPLGTEFFLYTSNMTPVTTGFTVTNKTISGLTPLTTYVIHYLFTYTGGASVLNIGQRLFNGYFKLSAKMRLKDDTDGHVKTALLEIPHVRLMSDLSMRLGSVLTPNVSTFRLMGDPVGERKNQYVCQFIFLSNDIDSTI